MAVHTLGNTGAPSAGANDTAAYNEIGPTGFLNLGQNCYITQLAGYFGATSGSMTAHLLLVGSGGSLLVDAGGQSVGGQTWQIANITPHYMASGSNIGVAWWVSAEVHFSVYGTGKFQAESVGSPSNLNGYQPGSPYYQGGTGYYLQWIDPLAVSSVSPANGAAGASVTLSGSGFVGGSISSITFGGVAASYTVNSDTSITVTVPGGAPGGSQTLQVNSDHGSGSVGFYVNEPPSISGISPTGGGVGASVTISGGYFDSVSAVDFNGTGATYSVSGDTSITATVPAGATSGPIHVTTPWGTAASATFTVYSAHAYDGTNWQTSVPYAYDGTNWQIAQVFIYDGTNWQSSE